MRLTRLKVRGVMAYEQPVEVDFDELGGGLIAITGNNGAGKTTLIDSVFLAIHGFLPSYPESRRSHYDFFRGDDAYVEASFVDGNDRLDVRMAVDATRRRTDKTLTVNGEAEAAGKHFQAAATARFGSPDLLLASVFGAQDGAGDFLGMAKRDRKALFVELLGIGELQEYSTAAGTRASTMTSEIDIDRARIQEMRGESSDVDAALQRLGLANEEVDRLTGVSGDANDALTAHRADQERAARAEEKRRSWREKLAGAEADLKVVADELEPSKQKMRRAEETHLQHLASFDVDANAVRARVEAGIAEARRHTADELAKLTTQPTTAPTREEAEAIDTDERCLRKPITAAAVHIATLDAAGEAVRQALLGETRETERLGADIAALEGAVLTPPCGTAGGWIPDTGAERAPLRDICPLLDASRTAQERIPDLQRILGNRGGAHDHPLNLARADVETANAAFADAWIEGERLQAAANEAHAKQDEIQPRRAALEQRRQGAARYREEQARRDRLTTDLARAERDGAKEIQEAEGRAAQAGLQKTAAISQHKGAMDAFQANIRRLERQQETATQQRAAADDALRALEGDPKPDAARTTELTAAAERAATAYATAQEAKGRAQAAFDTAQELQARVQPLIERVAEAQRVRDAWTELSRACGRDGIQALEIDAASPEVTAIANELLEGCFDGRFSVELTTQREKRDGGMAEDFDVVVYDDGAERHAANFSGGERTVISEAIACAIAIYSARKSETQWRVLFRDETGSALSRDNAIAYTEMLRSALSVGGFDQVVYISHTPASWQLADSRLHCAGGKVEAGTPALEAA